MNFSDYVVPIISVSVYLVFAMIKGLIPDNAKKYIPLFAGILGMALYAWYSGGFDFAVALGGLASGLAATGIDQSIKSGNE